jgi:hypothetical protein
MGFAPVFCALFAATSLARVGAGEPFGVLVAGASEAGDALAAEEGPPRRVNSVALHAGGHRTAGEVAPRLAFGLAIENCGAERGNIELGREPMIEVESSANKNPAGSEDPARFLKITWRYLLSRW